MIDNQGEAKIPCRDGNISFLRAGVFIDKNTGLTFQLFTDNDRQGTTDKPVMHIVFGGTGADTESGIGCEKDGKSIRGQHLRTDILGLSGATTFVPPMLRQASEIVGLLKATFVDYDLEVKGFSQGGAIATYAGIKNECRTVALCPAPLSPACQDDLGDEKMRKAVKNGMITNLSVKGCFVSDQKNLKNMGNSLERWTGHRIPHMIGAGYRIEKHDETGSAHLGAGTIWKTFAQKQL